MPGASTFAPWGHWEDPGTFGGRKKKYFQVQAWIFIDFDWVHELHVESLLGTLDHKNCILSCLFPGSFFLPILGSESGCLGLGKTKQLASEMFQK